MPKDAVETIAALVARIKEGRSAPVDIMLLYKALQELDPADASRVIEETTHGAYAVVPTEPPPGWNAVQKRAYRIFLKKVMEAMVVTTVTAPDA